MVWLLLLLNTLLGMVMWRFEFLIRSQEEEFGK
jgi:hypothetical protein